MQQLKHIVIVAGEESGDIHAAHFVKQLKTQNSNLHFTGIGGQHMQDTGVELISDLARFGVTGLTEVVKHLGVIRRAFRAIKNHLSVNKPDLLILVDYPGFNLRLAKFAKQVLGIRIIYYISPQIWAWKANRIHTIRENIDHMAVILPFEKQIYQQANVPVSFVGHPLVEKTIPQDQDSARQLLALPHDKRIIAMLPGSRIHEIERHMPILSDCAVMLSQQDTKLHFVIPVARTINLNLIENYLKNKRISYTLIQEKAIDVINASDCVVVASGTASLECALLKKPMCIIYKGALLSYIAAFKLIKVKYLGLCNLLMNKMVVPELLQYDCNSIELTKMLDSLLNDTMYSQRLITKLSHMVESLSTQQADCSITEIIQHELQQDGIIS